MNKTQARQIVNNGITNQELFEMLEKARSGIADWTVVSNVNKGMSKGAAWNVLGKDFDISKEHHFLYKLHLVREYGEFLFAPKAQKKQSPHIVLFHQEPILNQ